MQQVNLKLNLVKKDRQAPKCIIYFAQADEEIDGDCSDRMDRAPLGAHSRKRGFQSFKYDPFSVNIKFEFVKSK